jgi:arylsulfatase
VSLAPTLRGETAQQETHESLYWGFKNKQAARRGKWKAVRQPMGSGPTELYNLEEDPSESNNVAEAHPDVVQQMEAIMEREHTPSDE